MAEPAYICIRETVDWADEAAFRAQLPPEYAPTIALWDATFNIPYHLFRHRLREIASANLSQVRGAHIAAWDDVPAGALVLPVDDDDWFAPDAVEVVQAARQPDRMLYRWPIEFLETPIDWMHAVALMGRRWFGTAPKWICSTNNYALIKTADATRLFRSHVAASHWVAANAARTGVLREHVSLMNRTLASRTSLHIVKPERVRDTSRVLLLRKYARYRRLYARRLPADLAWSRPYVAMMHDLMQQLRPAAGESRRRG